MQQTLPFQRHKAFTLLETVIAIGVLAVLLTGFIMVFAPAAAGIKTAIDVEEADRLATTLEKELVTLRQGQDRGGDDFTTGFDKAFHYVRDSHDASTALLVYKYRGRLRGSSRTDGTPEPFTDKLTEATPGSDYIVQTMVRAKDDPMFDRDLDAVEGPVYLVKCTQLVFNSSSGELSPGTEGEISDPTGMGGTYQKSDDYPDAVISFVADYYRLPGRSSGFFNSNAFSDAFDRSTKPVFSRNLAVRR